MKALTDVQVEYALKTTHSRWRLEGKFIRRDFVFKNFVEAWGFMNSVALLAESMDHHPNWDNVYNQVTIRLSTHDADGLTEKDFQLAGAIDSGVAVVLLVKKRLDRTDNCLILQHRCMPHISNLEISHCGHATLHFGCDSVIEKVR